MSRSPTAPDRLRRAFANPYLLLTLTMLMWGGNTVAGKLAVGEITPLGLTALRWILVGTVMLVACRRGLAAHWPSLKPRLGYLAFMGIAGYTTYNALFYEAAYTTSAININIVTASLPAMILIGAVVAYRQRVRLLQWAGVAVSITGVAIGASHGSLETLRHLAFNVGDGLMVIATIVYAVYSLNLRRRPAVPAIVFFAAIAPAAAVSSLALLGVEAFAGNFAWPTLNGWLVLAYVAIFPSLVAQIFFIRAVELIGPGRAGLFANLMPVFGALLSTLILGETFEGYHAVAMALTIGGIVLAEMRQPRRPGPTIGGQ